MQSDIQHTLYTNLHTHTARCGHATGTDREYVEKAIEAGYKILGFSDHAPWIFPDGFESFYRVKTAEAPSYIRSVNGLRDEYSDKIEIHVGFEMEYYPLYFDDMLENVKKLGAEYIILGEHFVKNEHPDGFHVGSKFDDASLIDIYVHDVCEAIEKGIYTYVAHPDMCNYTGDGDFLLDKLRKICITAKREGVPLEINMLGIRDRRIYPNEKFWEMAAAEGCSVVIGADAHTPESLTDDCGPETAFGIIDKYKLNWIREIPIIKI